MNDISLMMLISAIVVACIFLTMPTKNTEIENNNSQANKKEEEEEEEEQQQRAKKKNEEQTPPNNDGFPEVEMQNADVDINKPLFPKAGAPVRNTINAVKSAVDFVKTNQRLKQAELANTVLMQQMDIIEKVSSEKGKLEEEKLKLELEKMRLENEKLKLELENEKRRAENKSQ